MFFYLCRQWYMNRQSWARFSTNRPRSIKHWLYQWIIFINWMSVVVVSIQNWWYTSFFRYRSQSMFVLWYEWPAFLSTLCKNSATDWLWLTSLHNLMLDSQWRFVVLIFSDRLTSGTFGSKQNLELNIHCGSTRFSGKNIWLPDREFGGYLLLARSDFLLAPGRREVLSLEPWHATVCHLDKIVF
jgi:hypothetical protein